MWIWNKLFSLINNFVDDPELQNMLSQVYVVNMLNLNQKRIEVTTQTQI